MTEITVKKMIEDFSKDANDYVKKARECKDSDMGKYYMGIAHGIFGCIQYLHDNKIDGVVKLSGCKCRAKLVSKPTTRKPATRRPAKK